MVNAKAVSKLVGKYLAGIAVDTYSGAFNSKIALQTSLIPSKIRDMLGTTGTNLALGAISFTNTFSDLFMVPTLEYPKVEAKVKSIRANPNLTSQQKKEKIEKLVTDFMFYYHNKVGVQSWIDLINFLIPIPFVGIPPYKPKKFNVEGY